MVEGFKQHEGEERLSDEEKAEEEFKKNLGKFFDVDKDNLPNAIHGLISRMKPFLDSDFLKDQGVEENLLACTAILEKDEFVGKMLAALKPYLDFKKNHPMNFESIERLAYYEQFSDRIPINDVMCYEKKGNKIAIHIPPSKYVEGSKRSLFLEAFKKLAEIINHDETIDEIEGESWIIGDKPALLVRSGFTLGEFISEESRVAGVPQRRAYITRKDFLEKYLRKEK